jgi:hypothetical protein
MREVSVLSVYGMGPWWGSSFSALPAQRGTIEEGEEVTDGNLSKALCAAGSERCVNNTDTTLAVATVLHAAAAVEDWTLGATPVPAQVAIVYAQSSEIWEAHSSPSQLAFGDVVYRAFEGLWTEKQMLHVALATYLQLTVDVLPEVEVAAPGRLDQYKLIYLVDPHLHTAAADAITSWVWNGGTIWSQARAATRDEYNQSTIQTDLISRLFDSRYLPSKAAASIELLSGPPHKYQEVGPPGQAVLDLPQLDTVIVGNFSFPALACVEALHGFEGANVHGHFGRSSRPALISFAAGKGTVWRLATVLGAPMAATADPPFGAHREFGDVWPEWKPSRAYDMTLID